MLQRLRSHIQNSSLIKTAFGSFGLKIAAAGLGFINGILLARLLGPTEFGAYSIIFSTINLTATVALLGLPMLVTREAAANAARGQWKQLKGLLYAAHMWTLLAALTILSISAFLFTKNFIDLKISRTIIVITMALVPMIALNQLRAAFLRGLHRVILADIPELLIRPIVMLLLLIWLYLTPVQASTTSALYIQLATITSALIIGSWWLISLQPRLLKAAKAEPSQWIWLLDALPFLGISLISTLEGQVSLYLLGYFGKVEQAGLFQVANQLVGLIAIGLVAVNTPLQPKLAAAWAQGDKQQIQRLVSETVRITTGIGLVGVVIMLFFAETVLGLYGPHYVEAANALRILSIGQMVNAAAGSCGILLMMTGYQKIVMHGTMIALLLNFSVAYWTIPQFGVEGSALASTLGVIFWNIFYATYLWKKLALNTTIF